MVQRLLIIISLLFVSTGPAFAGPPLQTDDTGTPGDKHWEINIAYTLDKRHTVVTHQTPILDLNYGVGDNIQLKYEVPWLVLHENGVGTKSGLGNSVAGMKWRFLDEKRDGVAMSVYPQFEFNNPTNSADRGIVDEGTDLRLPLQATKKFGPVWLNGEVGYTFRQHNDDEWLYGLSSGYEIREDLTLLGEVHGGSTKEFKKHEVVFNVGTQWDFDKKYGLLASIGRSFRSGASGEPNLLLYLGLQIRL
ncbi:transporter [Geobacter argillaceus]|uniref:Outer membrane putative beta-barrel porin/alpha-amylase n=1 Tax=Geobacter argillaceus TaxID=345631 RepID=A0A562VIL7_9BACT|nr:transporter [Geobacter argillaceus]TWJ17567.1 outer membrane putative beta-barrel porin/alpha-amylase [Geobacter argillaceus]